MRTFIPIAGALCAGLVLATPASAGDTAGARLFVNIMFQMGDKDSNGQLDPAEIAALRLQAFERADKDGDGTLSRPELEAAVARQKRRADMARAMGDEQIQRFDLDGDGAITRAEFETAPRPGFALVDVNSDGALDRAEIDRILSIIAQAR